MPAANTHLAVRQNRVDEVVTALVRTIPGSCVLWQGSPGAGTSDAYSDIDLAWIVPDAEFERAVAETAAALGRIAPLVEARAKPQLARSRRRRLLFVRFADMPLLWHLDLDVRCASIADDGSFDSDDPDARSEDGWSRPASALANAIAAVKALGRGRTDFALGTLSLGFERIGLPPPPAASRDDRGPRGRVRRS